MNMTTTTNSKLFTTAKFDRSLIWGRGGSVRYMLAEITCNTQEGGEPQPLNLAFVIDASGSMAGSSIKAAKNAATRLVDQLKDRDHLSIVAFDSNARIVAKTMKCDSAGRKELKRLIKPISDGSATDLSGGWLLGAECVAGFEGSNLTQNHVILLSDGHANHGIVDPGQLGLHARELAARGVMSSAVGIGDGYSPIQLNAISDNGGGRTHDAERPHEIAEVVGGELTELRGIVLENIRLSVWGPESTELEVLSAFSTVDSYDGSEIRLGSLSKNGKRRVVVRATCTDGTPGGSIDFGCEVEAREISSKDTVTSDELVATLTFARGRDNTKQLRDDDIAAVVAQEWQGHAIRHAVELNGLGEYEKATEYLLYQLKHFKRYCIGLPGAAQLVDDFELAARRMGSPMHARYRMEIDSSYRHDSRMERDHRMTERPAPASYMKR
jgi:Ca-activated chloride channel family protein